MTQIVSISKQGKDVLTESDPNNYIFDSRYNTFKIISEGTLGGSVGSPGATYNVVHNMGAANPFYAYILIQGAGLYENINNTFITNVAIGTGGVISINYWQLTGYNTANTLTLSLNAPNSDTAIVKYYIFAKP